MSHPVPYREIQKYLGSLIQVEERIDYREGQMIFYEGHQPYGLYVLRRGRVRLFQKHPNGEEKLIQVVEPGYLFGEKAFLENVSYDASAKAETDASVSFFSRMVFCKEEHEPSKLHE